MSNSWSTIKRARTLGMRHPNAPPSVKAVAMYLASFAEGAKGTTIYPGNDKMSLELGLHKSIIKRALAWLEKHGEIRQDTVGKRGSASCYTYLGVHLHPEQMVVGSELQLEVGSDTRRGSAANSHQPIARRNEPEGSSSQKVCEMTGCGGSLVPHLYLGEATGTGRCARCHQLSPL